MAGNVHCIKAVFEAHQLECFQSHLWETRIALWWKSNQHLHSCFLPIVYSPQVVTGERHRPGFRWKASVHGPFRRLSLRHHRHSTQNKVTCLWTEAAEAVCFYRPHRTNNPQVTKLVTEAALLCRTTFFFIYVFYNVLHFFWKLTYF